MKALKKPARCVSARRSASEVCGYASQQPAPRRLSAASVGESLPVAFFSRRYTMFPSRRRQRTFKPALAPLEERLALSALPLVAQEVHSLAKRTPPSQDKISGTVSLTHGTDLQFTKLNVTFGKLKLKGSGSGTFSGGRIVNGELHLSGPKGKMTLQ